MRIAMAVRNLPGRTGTSGTILQHTEALSRRGHPVDVFGLTLRSDLVERAGGRPRSLRRLWGNSRAAFARRWERSVGEGRYGLTLGHGDVFVQDILFLHNLVRRTHLEVHGRPDGPGLSDVAGIHDHLLAKGRFRLLVANSQLMADELVERNGIPAEKVRVVRPGFDEARFLPAPAGTRPALREALGVPRDGFVWGFVTSGDFRKRGIDLFVDAIQRLPRAVQEASTFVLVGKARPAELAAQLARIPDPALRARVTYRPPTDAVERVYQAIDALVHPARFEEFGQVVQEAMACGVPVITSKKVGAWELQPENPFLMESPGADALADRMTAAFEDAGLLRKAAADAIVAAEANRSSRTLERTFEVFRECGLDVR